MKKEKKYIFFFLVIFILLITVEYFAPKPIDWTQTFLKRDKIPYGTYVLRDVLPLVFPGSEIDEINETFYNYFHSSEKEKKGNIIVINNHFNPDDLDLKELLDYVNKGNNAFIAAENFSNNFMDTLEISVNMHFQASLENDSCSLFFINSDLISSEKYWFKTGIVASYFDSLNINNTTSLAKTSYGKTNFISVDFGKGRFYLHTAPLAFTNYSLLSGNNIDYVAATLSHLPNQDTYWNEYYKVGKANQTTPLYVILNSKALKTAFYLLLAGFLIYIIFVGKRTQRMVPVIEPLKNTSLEFVETLGRLYYYKSTHKNIAEKKILFLFNHIRNEYNLNPNKPDDEFKSALVLKSKLSDKHINRLFNFINEITVQSQISPENLLKLNNLIDHFYIKTR